LSIEEKIELMTPKQVVCYKTKKLMLDKIRALIFRDWDEVSVVDNSVSINPYVFHDLEVFTDYEQHDNQSVISKIDRTSTMFGRVSLEEMIKNPIHDSFALTMRQKVTQTILESDYKGVLYELLDSLSGTEPGILWYWEEITDDMQSLYDMVYFNFESSKSLSDFLNGNEEVLLASTFYSIMASPVMSAMGPVLGVITPLIFLKYNNPDLPLGSLIVKTIRATLKLDLLASLPTKMKMTVLAGMVGWVCFYFYSIYSCYKSALHIHTIVNLIHEKIGHIARFVAAVRKLYSLCLKLEIPIADFAVEEALKRFKQVFSNSVLLEEPQLFNNKGCILNTYRRFLLAKEMLLPLVGFVAQVDSYASVARLYEEFDTKDKKQHYCFVEFGQGEGVQFNAKKMWHPYLDTDVVTNSVQLNANRRNLLVTGPNAAGKSTFIKGVALSVLLAQTFGIAPADRLTMVPFEIVNSYLQIPDCKGRESLFQAEMHRCKDHLDTLEAESERRSFVIMDEIFSSTNYKEGLSAAYAVCKKLVEYPNSVSIITTHYTPLGSLAEETEGKIHNCRFNAKEDEDTGDLHFNYKLDTGVSDQYIALKLLKLDGFDVDIITDAMEMCGRVQLSVQDSSNASEPELLNESNS